MKLKIFNLGPYQTNCYLIFDQTSAMVIDPAKGEEIFQFLVNNKLELKYILNTHGHGDHTAGNYFLKQKTPAKLAIHTADEFFLSGGSVNKLIVPSFKEVKPDILLSDRDSLNLHLDDEDFTVEVIHTPGHTPGSVCFLTSTGLFSGDTIFYRGIGRFDFPYSSGLELKSSLQKLINIIPPDTLVFPGHGPKTIFGEEKEQLLSISYELESR